MKLKTSDYIQIFIALILIGNILFFWKQHDLTQTLNQPLCAVKNVRLIPVRPDVYKIYATIMNSGNYVAEKVAIDWGLFLVEKLKDPQPIFTPIDPQRSKNKTEMTLLPKHELDFWIIYIDKKDIDKMVDGYEKAIAISLTVEYKNMDNVTQRYSCIYLITRMLSTDDPYDVQPVRSKLEILTELPLY
jgi:hypothetical protein